MYFKNKNKISSLNHDDQLEMQSRTNMKLHLVLGKNASNNAL